MPPTKYKFDPDSLSFDKIRLGIKTLLLRFLAYFIGSVIIALVYWGVFASFFDSPVVFASLWHHSLIQAFKVIMAIITAIVTKAILKSALNYKKK